MKILHVITGMQKAAGTSVFCGEVANGLAGCGHEITIAVNNPSSTDVYPLDSRVRLIGMDSLKDPSFDVVHIHALWSPELHHVGKWAHKYGLPVVWSPHGMLTPWALNNKKWKKRLAWWLYQKRDLASAVLLHATAESEVEDFRRVGLRNPVKVIPLGVDILHTISHSTKSLDGVKILLFVSRVQKKKGLMNLVAAWAKLPNDIKRGWRVRVVGPDQENHTAELKEKCERLGVKEFEFVGPKFGDDLSREYAAADLFVLPTFSENFGSVVIEALAHEVPVICTKGAPWCELEEYKCGCWIEIGVEPLAEALKKMLTCTDDERLQMGKRGRRLVEERYTWDAVVKSMLSGYESIL